MTRKYKKNTFQNHEEKGEIPWTNNKEGGLENSTLKFVMRAREMVEVNEQPSKQIFVNE